MIAETTETKISNQRLLRLADFLDTLPPERFAFSKWVDYTWLGAEDLSCGAAGCAIGWASTLSEFRELGLRLKRSEGRLALPVNVGTGSNGFDAVAEIFMVTQHEALYLFAPYGNGNNLAFDAYPDEVAAHIRRFVANRES